MNIDNVEQRRNWNEEKGKLKRRFAMLTDNDLMFEVVDDKALFFGDVVGNKYIPNSDVPQDASFKGSITAIKTNISRAVMMPPYAVRR